jgi:septum site-determining protein MinC
MEEYSCIEIEHCVESITSIKILSNNTELLQEEINVLISKSPDKYFNKPIIIDVHSKSFQANDLAVLIEILAQNELVAIGVRTTKQELIDFVRFSGLAVFSHNSQNIETTNLDKAKPKVPKLSPDPHKDKVYKAPIIIANQVTSNKQAHAEDCDLVLLKPVMLDGAAISYGSISAYQEVRGKLFAGTSGDTKATIFIHSFKAQLISIAGVYKKFDSIPTKLFEKSVVIDLFEGKLRFKAV